MYRYLKKFVVLAAFVGLAACFNVAPASSAPGVISSGGMRVTAAADASHVVPAGGDIARGVPFVHAVKVSGNYSVAAAGSPMVRRGEIVAGYLIGCAVDISNGITVGIAPTIGVGIAPSIGVNIGTPPSISVGVSPSVNAGLAGVLSVSLAPGSVMAAIIGTASLDREARFPYTFSHTNTPLNISGCMSPASAMPFVTVRLDGTNSTVQTTGYGAEFGF